MSRLLTRACGGVCALLLFSSVQAGDIDPSLQQAIDQATAGLPPEQAGKVKIDVIVRFTDPLDPNASKPNRGRTTITLVQTLNDNTASADDAVLEFLAQPGVVGRVSNIKTLRIINGMSMTVEAGLIPALSNQDKVDTVSLDAAMSVPDTSNSSAAPGGWNINDGGANALWDLVITGQDMVIATLDSSGAVRLSPAGGAQSGTSTSFTHVVRDARGAISNEATCEVNLAPGRL